MRSSGAAIATGLVFIFGISLTSISSVSFLGEASYGGYYDFWLTFQAIKLLENFPVMGILKILPSVLLSIAYFVIFFLIGIVHFNKKDL